MPLKPARHVRRRPNGCGIWLYMLRLIHTHSHSLLLLSLPLHPSPPQHFLSSPQAKILTTALFARAMMGKEMHNRKWRALTLVVLGAMLITNQRRPTSDKENAVNLEYIIGIGACLLEITLSGAVSIYFEKVLKTTTTNHTVTISPNPHFYSTTPVHTRPFTEHL